MRPNKLREVLNAGQPTIGTHVHSTWPSIVEAVGAGIEVWIGDYQDAGYPVLLVSARTARGMGGRAYSQTVECRHGRKTGAGVGGDTEAAVGGETGAPAVAGGGGKGMRLIAGDAEFAGQLEAAGDPRGAQRSVAAHGGPAAVPVEEVEPDGVGRRARLDDHEAVGTHPPLPVA